MSPRDDEIITRTHQKPEGTDADAMMASPNTTTSSFLPSPIHDDTESNNNILLLDGSGVHDDDDDDDDDGFFIEDDMSGEQDVTPSFVPSSVSSSSTTKPINSSSTTTTTTTTTSFPKRSILKTSIEEEIPICTKKKSWKKLPAPDLQKVKLSRVESLNSFFHLTSSLADLDDDGGDDDTATTTKRLKKVDSKVNFQNITIREYGQTIGDNPSVSHGTPVSLDWDYEENEPLDLDMYEANRGNRRTNRQMFLNHYQRRNMLVHKWGYSEEEVKQVKKETKKVKNQRETSKYIQLNLQPLTTLEEIAESAVRKFKRRQEQKNNNNKNNNKNNDDGSSSSSTTNIGRRHSMISLASAATI